MKEHPSTHYTKTQKQPNGFVATSTKKQTIPNLVSISADGKRDVKPLNGSRPRKRPIKLLTVPEDHHSYGLFTTFWLKLAENRNMIILDGSAESEEMFAIVQDHVARIVLAEARESVPISLVHSSSPESMMCSDLISAAILNLIPQVRVAFASCFIGVMITRLARNFGSNVKNIPPQDFQVFKKWFTFKGNGVDEIHTVIVPLNISNTHWGVLVGKHNRSSTNKRQQLIIWFGDSLGFRCDHSILQLFSQVFSSCMTGDEKRRALISNQNYMQQVKGFKKQRDSYSCGCYVISLCKLFSTDKGFLPKQTYATGYSKALTERIRWMSIKTRILHVMMAKHYYRVGQVTETMVIQLRSEDRVALLRMRRAGIFNKRVRKEQERRKDGAVCGGEEGLAHIEVARGAERPKSSGSASTQNVGTWIGDSKIASTAGTGALWLRKKERSSRVDELNRRNADEVGRLLPIMIRKKRRVRFFDSSPIVADLINSLIDTACSTSTEIHQSRFAREDTGSQERVKRGRMAPTDIQNPHQLEPCLSESVSDDLHGRKQAIVEEQPVQRKDGEASMEMGSVNPSASGIIQQAMESIRKVVDLQAFVAFMAKQHGYLYGVQYFSPLLKRTSKSAPLVSGKLRCLRHKTKCRSNIRAKYYPMEGCWILEKDLIHNHEPENLPCPHSVVKSRFEAIRSSLVSRQVEWEEHVRKLGENVHTACTFQAIPLFRGPEFYHDSSCYSQPPEKAIATPSQNTSCDELPLCDNSSGVSRSPGQPSPSHEHIQHSQAGTSICENAQDTAIQFDGAEGISALNTQGIPHDTEESNEGAENNDSNTRVKSDGEVSKRSEEVIDEFLNVTSDVEHDLDFPSFQNAPNSGHLIKEDHPLAPEEKRSHDKDVLTMSEDSGTLESGVGCGNEASDRQSDADNHCSFIDRFLDDEEEVPSCFLDEQNITAENDEVRISGTVHSSKGEHNEVGLREESPSDEGGTEEAVSKGIAENCFRNAVLAYLETLPHDAPGISVLREVQFIADCLGYNLFVRTSIYRGEPRKAREGRSCTKKRSESGNRRVLRKGILKCEQYNNKKSRCPFSLTIKTEESHEDEDGAMIYVVNLTGCTHSHEPGQSFGVRHLKPEMRKEAFHMTNNLHMAFPDTIRYLEDKYKRKIDPVLTRKKLRYASSTSNPRDLECVRLCDILFSLSQEDVGHKTFFAADETGRMKYACWSFREWLEEYQKFGIVPGISIDCKAIANRYGFPLVTLNGRGNDGHVLTFFMGYMCSETEEDFVRILSYFKSIIPVSPAMITMDQNTACINAAEKIFDKSYISLDEWHLNENQKRNVAKWCAKVRRLDWLQDMKKDLFDLRKSKCSESFFERRRKLEATYFTPFGERLPLWYRYLYHTKPHMVISCFRQAAVPKSYLFQGTGYTEASNSAFKKLIISKKIPLHKVPLEVRRLAQQRADTRKSEVIRTISSQSARYRRTRQLENFLPIEVVDKMVTEYTNYSLSQFVELSFRLSRNYVVSKTEIVDYSPDAWPEALRSESSTFSPAIGRVVRFALRWGNHLKSQNVPVPRKDGTDSHSETVVQFAKRYTGSGDSVKEEFIGICSCAQPAAVGFACRHMVRCAVVYQEQRIQYPELQNILGPYIPLQMLTSMFWKKDTSVLTVPYLAKLRSETGYFNMEELTMKLRKLSSSTEENVLQIDGNILKSCGGDKDVDGYYSDMEGKSLYDALHRQATGIGNIAVNGVLRLLRDAIAYIQRGDVSHSQTRASFGSAVALLHNNDEQYETTNTILHPSSATNTFTSEGILPPNHGRHRLQRRKKGALERRKKRSRTSSPQLSQNVSRDDPYGSSMLLHPSSHIASRADINEAQDKALNTMSTSLGHIS